MREGCSQRERRVPELPTVRTEVVGVGELYEVGEVNIVEEENVTGRRNEEDAGC